ncbi:uncharacterized protein [Oryctolagus cuniculus]|uniref:uncharacterized protein n=1 Tax=Oryctolagus cuniculus TaxID=9986 RepID=UPI003879E52E
MNFNEVKRPGTQATAVTVRFLPIHYRSQPFRLPSARSLLSKAAKSPETDFQVTLPHPPETQRANGKRELRKDAPLHPQPGRAPTAHPLSPAPLPLPRRAHPALGNAAPAKTWLSPSQTSPHAGRPRREAAGGTWLPGGRVCPRRTKELRFPACRADPRRPRTLPALRRGRRAPAPLNLPPGATPRARPVDPASLGPPPPSRLAHLRCPGVRGARLLRRAQGALWVGITEVRGKPEFKCSCPVLRVTAATDNS